MLEGLLYSLGFLIVYFIGGMIYQSYRQKDKELEGYKKGQRAKERKKRELAKLSDDELDKRGRKWMRNK